MEFNELIQSPQLKLKSSSSDKNGLLNEIAELAEKSPLASKTSKNEILKGLKKREELGSTGFGRSVAIPHCMIEGVDDFIIGIITHESGLDFNALDNNDVKLFIFIIAPSGEKTRHIQILSAISKILKIPDAPDEIYSASSEQELKQRFLSYVKVQPASIHNEKVLFNVFIQNEEYFYSILQIFSEAAEGSVSVLELNNAGSYLHKMPIFSAFWQDEQQSQDSKLITAVVEKALMNDIIRRIHMIAEGRNGLEDVLVTVQNLSYTDGQINF